MCSKCTGTSDTDLDQDAAVRVTSLATFSSALLSAFADSEGNNMALVFVDGDDDVYELGDIEFDSENNCIKVRLSGAWVSIDAEHMQKKVRQVNGVE